MPCRHFVRLATPLRFTHGSHAGKRCNGFRTGPGVARLVKAQRPMGHGHLVLFGSGRLLRPRTRTERHSLALHAVLLYNTRAPDDLLSDRGILGTLRRGGLASLSFLGSLLLAKAERVQHDCCRQRHPHLAENLPFDMSEGAKSER